MILTVDAPQVGKLTFHCHDAPEHIGQVIQQSQRIYEYDLLKHIAETVPREGIWVDVGACIGTHTVFFAKLGLEVLAFEPVYANAELLDENLLENAVDAQVQLYTVALGAKETAVRLEVTANNMGLSRIIEEHPLAPIPMLPLDEIVSRTGKIGLIKIDVEGYEVEVLQGARKTLKQWHPRLFIESLTDRLWQVDAILKEFGYTRGPKSFCVTPVWSYQ